MNKVQRFTQIWDDIVERDNGEYVLHNDYLALQKRCEKLEEQVKNLQERLDAYDKEQY